MNKLLKICTKVKTTVSEWPLSKIKEGQGRKLHGFVYLKLRYFADDDSDEASPEFISHKDDSTLQQQRGKDTYHLPYTEATEQTVKVHMLQSGVSGTPQLNDLNKHKELELDCGNNLSK